MSVVCEDADLIMRNRSPLRAQCSFRRSPRESETAGRLNVRVPGNA